MTKTELHVSLIIHILLDMPSWQGIWIKPLDYFCWGAWMAWQKTFCSLDQECMHTFYHFYQLWK